MAKYNANWEITNTYENLHIVQSLSVFRFDVNEHKHKELFSYIGLFIIFGHILMSDTEGNLKLFAITYCQHQKLSKICSQFLYFYNIKWSWMEKQFVQSRSL